MKKALLIVDIQNDFLPGGSLAVPSGDEIIPWINKIQSRYDLVAATQDWHPPDHVSFAKNHQGHEPFQEIEVNGHKQILWPEHCVRGTEGAEFASELDLRAVAAIFRKGMDSGIDSYSGFFDTGHQKSTGLADWLNGLDIEEIHVCGLAAEICVAYTARDAAELGFTTSILERGTRSIQQKDYEECKARLARRGVMFIP